MERIVKPTVIVAPTREPVTVAEAQVASAIDVFGDGQSELLEQYIQTAREYVEARAGITIHETTLELTPDCYNGNFITLWRATPLIEIVSFIYKDSDGVPTTWDSSNYIADVDRIPGRLMLGYGKTWPSFVPYPVSPIRIRYKAGIAVESPVVEAPGSIKTGVLLLVAALWENREAEVIPDGRVISAIALKYGVDAFIDQHIATYAF